MKLDVAVICDCGEKMVTNAGVSSNGLIVEVADNNKYTFKTKYKGGNENFICLKCKTTTKIYVGFLYKEETK